MLVKVSATPQQQMMKMFRDRLNTVRCSPQMMLGSEALHTLKADGFMTGASVSKCIEVCKEILGTFNQKCVDGMYSIIKGDERVFIIPCSGCTAVLFRNKEPR